MVTRLCRRSFRLANSVCPCFLVESVFCLEFTISLGVLRRPSGELSRSLNPAEVLVAPLLQLHDPDRQADRFRLARVRSPLLAGSLRFLLLRLLGCFGSLGSLRIPIFSGYGDRTLLRTGSPIRASRDLSFCAAPPGVSPLARPSSATCP